LRHTALKNIANATGKIEIVATVAGHDNINTSKRYISPSMKEIAEAMKGVEYDF
jgi:integrase